MSTELCKQAIIDSITPELLEYLCQSDVALTSTQLDAVGVILRNKKSWARVSKEKLDENEGWQRYFHLTNAAYNSLEKVSDGPPWCDFSALVVEKDGSIVDVCVDRD